MPTVSVIIPTYGEPDLLGGAIDSVLSQTYRDFELIVVDDNNPCTAAREATEAVMSKYLKYEKVKYIKHSKNKNGAAARNTGLKEASGEYIAFLDSDDLYMPTRLEKCLSALCDAADPRCMGVYTGCEFRRNGKTYRLFSDIESGNFLRDTLATTFMFSTGSNIFMRREAIEAVCGFDENFLRHQDYEFLVRYFEKYDLLAIAEVLVIKNNDNKNLPNAERVREIKEQYIKKYTYIIDTLSDKDMRYVYSSQYIQIAEAYLQAKNFEEAKKYYALAKRYMPFSVKTILRRAAFWIKSRI